MKGGLITTQRASGLSARITGLIRALPGISRVQLSQSLALSPATVSRSVQELVDLGCLRESPGNIAASGRPRVGLYVDPSCAYALVLDIKVESAVAGFVDFSGQLLDREVLDEPMGDVARAMDSLPRLMGRMLNKHVAEADHLLGVGVAITGTWNTLHRALVFSPSLPQWHGVNLEQPFRSLPGEYLVVDNDSRAAASAEMMIGSGRRFQDFVYLYGDYGIGSAIVHRRTIVRGQENLGSGMGHMLISLDPTWPICDGCGRRGCLGAVVNAAIIAERIGRGSPRAEVLSAVADYLAVAVANLLNQLCPEAIVLGGRLFHTYTELYPMVVKACRERLLEHILHRVAFVRAELDPDAALVGMATQVFSRDTDVSTVGWGRISS